MKKIKKYIRRWRYRRLFYRLMWYYITKNNSVDMAGIQAADAFSWMTGREWKDWC